MPLLNYTTKVPVYRSIEQIQKLLVQAGASAVMTEYDDDKIVSTISFKIKTGENEFSFRLPGDWRSTLEVMKHDGTPRNQLTPEHAQRVAWRITKDWVEVQIALLQTRSVVLPQLFLPYMVNQQGSTAWQLVSQNPQILGLGAGE